MYPYPGWRRIFFVAVLIVILVITLAPSVTQGTIRVHVYSFTPSGIIDHLYIRLSSLELHTYGFGPAAGWVNVNQTTQPVDLIHAQAQFLPQLVASASLTSGRYDAIRLFLTNSTALIGTRPVSLPKTPILSANLTLPIQPKGFGDVLLLVSFDYSLILANPASLSMQIVQTSTT